MSFEARDIIDRHVINPGGQHDGWWACMCGAPWSGEHVLTALADVGFAVIKLPTVAYKAEGRTDAEFFRQVADRLADRRSGYVGGSNVREAASVIMRAVAAEAER